MIRCCVFDADGTLLDSMPMWRDITYEYAEQKGVHAPAGLHNTLNRLSMEQCAQHFGAAPQESVVFEDSAYAIRTARRAGFPVVAVEDAISTQGKTGDETREGLARLANLVIADYGQLIGRLTPAEDLSQGLGELLG